MDLVGVGGGERGEDQLCRGRERSSGNINWRVARERKRGGFGRAKKGWSNEFHIKTGNRAEGGKPATRIADDFSSFPLIYIQYPNKCGRRQKMGERKGGVEREKINPILFLTLVAAEVATRWSITLLWC